jgi:hypothetical protein
MLSIYSLRLGMLSNKLFCLLFVNFLTVMIRYTRKKMTHVMFNKKKNYKNIKNYEYKYKEQKGKN